MMLFDATFLTLSTIITLSLILYFNLLLKLEPAADAKITTFMKKQNARKSKTSTIPPQSVKPAEPARPQKKQETADRECPHYVGYLTTLPKASRFPDECFGCRNVIQCLRIEPTKVIESFYVTATEPE
ncbi:MAG: hypothetical protein NWE78_00520 [Candidatus Bathyarchaeota archaeon]|nr:hypothetical protein [Candidatus Bathyarchaeota archaeon]